MKKFLLVVLLAIAVLTFASTESAVADTDNGDKIFNANCSACHIGGGNVVMVNKTLKKGALEKYGMNSIDAIVRQVTNGKNSMPAFKGRLSSKQIQDVAAYVLEKSERGW